MRRQRGLVKLTGLAALVGLGMIAKPAVAVTTTEQSASILVFPKVIADGTRDTIIQITNTSNNMVHAHCFYVNGTTAPGGRGPWCLETDFDIWLTKQQPTMWVVSSGRVALSSMNQPTGGVIGMFLPGIPPATLIPPVAPDFQGELKCIQVDSSGAPLSGNALKGEATIIGDGPATAFDKVKYNAIGLKGFNTNDQDTVLCLGASTASNSACPNGREYEACPQGWFIDHPATMALPSPPYPGAPYGYTGSNLTVVPCTENFETQSPTSVTLQFLVTNEYEQTLSTSTTLTCWASWDLGSSETDSFLRTFNIGVAGGAQLQTRLRTANASRSGVIPVIEEYAGVAYPVRAAAARNAHQTPQDQAGMDIITFPADQGAVQ